MACTQTNMIQQVTPASSGCRLCLESGDTWVHLRMCLTCGTIGCCDASKNQHARKHAAISGHPIVQSFEHGEDWRYCYIDDEFLAPVTDESTTGGIGTSDRAV
jgi:uncharacterized UBP type Zn finger protein